MPTDKISDNISNDQSPEIGSDQETQETQETKDSGLSRRTFIRNAAAGAAGAAIAITGADNVLGQTAEETADVTVDGILLTVLSAPLGSRGTSSWTVTKTNAQTFRLVSSQNRNISLSANVSVTQGSFTVGGGIVFQQSNSTQVTNAITIRRSLSLSVTTPSPGVMGNTVLSGLLKPTIRFNGNPSSLRFRFLRADLQFNYTIDDLQNNSVIRSQFSQATIDAFLSQYAPLRDPFGTTLVEPRYRLKLHTSLSANVREMLTLTVTKGSVFSESKTATTSVAITQSFGFRSPTLMLAFQVGARIEITNTSVQEFSTDRVTTVSTTLDRAQAGVNKVFLDRVFKTFVIIDAGPPATSGQPVVRGVIRDPSGLPIARATVKLVQNAVDYIAITDANGNYTIATEAGKSLAAGTYPLTSGNVTKSVSISSGMTLANLDSVDPLMAKQRNFDYF